MKTYVINFELSNREEVLNLIKEFSNDIIIDKIEDDRVGITIEDEDEESDSIFAALKEEIANKLDLIV